VDINSTDGGGALHVKAGISHIEPLVEEDDTGYYRFVDFDKGEVGVSGSDVVVLESFLDDTFWDNWTLETVNNLDAPIPITTDENGEVWVIVGTESVAANATTVYYDMIEVDFD